METRTVVVIGAGGMLGRQVVTALASRGDVTVRGTYRPGKVEAARQIHAAGGTAVEADLAAPDTLTAALAGADVVVSTLQGGADVIVDGQRAVLAAAARAGVGRMIPSDYSVDLFRLDDGDNANLDLRRAFDRAFTDSVAGTVQPTSVLVGAFTDVVVGPYLGVVDWHTGVFSYWGDGEQPCDFTTVADAARYTAAAALDVGLTGRPLRVAGDVLTMLELHEALQVGSGRTLRTRHLGSVDALAVQIRSLREQAAPVERYVPLQYAWTMVSGKAKLDPLDNYRYPDIVPTSVAAFVHKAHSHPLLGTEGFVS